GSSALPRATARGKRCDRWFVPRYRSRSGNRKRRRRGRERPREGASLESPPFEAPGTERPGQWSRLDRIDDRTNAVVAHRDAVVGECGQGDQVHDGRRDHTVAPVAEVP